MIDNFWEGWLCGAGSMLLMEGALRLFGWLP
jgi:hypothetical protein